MPSLIFYRQMRVDGGVRTGVELDDQTIAEEFEGGNPDRDPALIWYVDLRCKGPGLPFAASDAMDWLLGQEPEIVRGLREFAEECAVGTDPDSYPKRWSKFSDIPPDVVMEIACSAIGRTNARQVADVLNDVAGRWSERLRRLENPLNVAR